MPVIFEGDESRYEPRELHLGDDCFAVKLVDLPCVQRYLVRNRQFSRFTRWAQMTDSPHVFELIVNKKLLAND